MRNIKLISLLLSTFIYAQDCCYDSTESWNEEVANTSVWIESGVCYGASVPNAYTDQVTCEEAGFIWMDTSSCSDGGEGDANGCDNSVPAVCSDGYSPTEELCCQNNEGSWAGDHDNDGICNDVDWDDDNDGIFDVNDACPQGEIGWNSWFDIDQDGCSEAEDVCPFDFHNDLDGDGLCGCTLTQWESSYIDNEQCLELYGDELYDTDNDGDGILNEFDACPNAADGHDWDEDGICDSSDPCIGDEDCFGTCGGAAVEDEFGDCCFLDQINEIGLCCYDEWQPPDYWNQYIGGECNCGADLVDQCGVCDGDGTSCAVLGDLNYDGDINVIDIVLLVNTVLDWTFDAFGDMNEDGVNDVVDIVLLVNLVLYNEQQEQNILGDWQLHRIAWYSDIDCEILESEIVGPIIENIVHAESCYPSDDCQEDWCFENYKYSLHQMKPFFSLNYL